MKHIISKLALKELEDARVYYNLEKEGLGEEFKAYVHNEVDIVFTSPYLYPVIIEPVHRKVLNTFPYNIFYRIDNKAIVILSIAHQRKKPTYTHK